MNVKVGSPDLNKTHISMQPGNNGIELKTQGVKVSVDADFEFKYIISVAGKADINITDIGVDFEADLSTQKANDSDQLAPNLTISKVVVNINPDDVNIKLSGSSAVVRIASIFIPLIKSTILP